jgi:hypothetical protein
MDIHKTIEEIKKLTYQMMEESVRERIETCSTIKNLIEDLQMENSQPGWGYVDGKITELIWHVESIAHLTDGNGHPDDRHHVWALGALNVIERNVSKAEKNNPIF